MKAALFSSLLARLVVVGLFFYLGWMLELIAPVGSIRRSSRLLNCLCGVAFHGADIATSLIVALTVDRLAGTFGKIPMPGDGHWFVGTLLVAFIWLSMRDFFYYWLHRWQHASSWLWAEHSVHHSEEEMNVTTAVRHHWLEMPLNALLVTAPMTLLFRPPLLTYPIVMLLGGSVGYLIHSNARLSIGWFSRLIASPQNHRIHHSRSPEHIDKNFAQFFPLWDVIFGTYYHPRPDEFPETGLSSGEKVETLSKAIAYPFQEWRKMLRARDSREPASVHGD